MQTSRLSGQQKWRLRLPLLVLAMALLGLGGFRLYATWSEGGLMSLLPALGGGSAHRLRLKEQPVYKVKKKQEMLGVQVTRIVSRRQPEEFLVLDGVSARLVDQVYGKAPNLSWANLMANQLIQLRESGEGGGSPVSVEIQQVKASPAGLIEKNRRKLPYWQVEVQFKLSNESASRYYEAGIVRNARAIEQSEPGQDTLVVGYAQKEAFQKELVSDLMDHLSFERN